ncbi:SIS domain-containing protein [Candidatus Pelagibacter sp. Uisw_137]|jgi:phosphoheptose isomerase|uniref:SIS domain-containing protein n=1 Tax=Candidatus Pelagibacter sp. Uisw_137 TaxID=3230992 RepID=UPI0039EC88AB|tara:strand:- start:254 stop:880 length:627 start_codon:yes stop_codon:yes gene_type:complete
MINFPTKKYLKSSDYFNDYISTKDLLLKKIDQKILNKIIQEILNSIKNKRDFFSCGNGGSAATAEHLSCDFSKGSCTNTNLNFKVFSLNSNVALMTAIANDISYDDVFSYQLNRYGKANDVLLAFSVSGTSKNIIKCTKIAKKKKIKIISFTGFNGGVLKKLSNYNINFPSNNFGIVEDCHLTIMHFISQYIRNLRFKSSSKIAKVNF